MKKYKGFELDYEHVLETDSDLNFCYELSQRDVFLILSQLPYLKWRTRWKNLSIGQHDLDRMIGSLEAKLLERLECVIDCQEVEDCLETSVIVTDIQNNVTSVQAQSQQNATDIDAIESTLPDIASGDGNIYPPSPTKDTDSDATCGAAFYIVDKLREFIVSVEASASTYANVIEALEAFVGFGINLVIATFYGLVGAFFSPSPPASVLTDYDANADLFREYLYCDSLSKASFENFVRNSGISSASQIADFIASLGSGTWLSWIAIGSADDSQDCSGYCAAPCIEYDFTVSDQGFTVWSTGSRPFGTYVSGVGWKAQDSVVSGDRDTRLYIELINMPSLYDMTDIELEYTSNEFNAGGGLAVRCTIGTTNQFATLFDETQIVTDGNVHTIATIHEDNDVDGIRINVTPNTVSPNPDAFVLKKLRIFFANNNPPSGGSPC